jgi:hypothetical protein
MGWNEGKKAFTTSAAVSAKRLVKMANTGLVAHCTEATADLAIGVSEYAGDTGDTIGVKLLNFPGTFEMTAAGVIAAGAAVYRAAAGKISATVDPVGKIGIALEAATADNDIIEVLPLIGAAATAVEAVKTIAASGAITPGSVTYIDGTAGAIAATLADDTVPGRLTTISMQDATNAATVSIAHHVTSDPEVATFDAVDETLVLMWTGTEYATIYATATFV